MIYRTDFVYYRTINVRAVWVILPRTVSGRLLRFGHWLQPDVQRWLNGEYCFVQSLFYAFLEKYLSNSTIQIYVSCLEAKRMHSDKAVSIKQMKAEEVMTRERPTLWSSLSKADTYFWRSSYNCYQWAIFRVTEIWFVNKLVWNSYICAVWFSSRIILGLLSRSGNLAGRLHKEALLW